MNIERLLKDAAATETREVTRDSLPPLDLSAAAPRHRWAGRWLVPVAAVLTVIAVMAMTVVLRGAPRGPDTLGGHDGPPFFLATHRKGGVGVFDSWTGRMIDDIPARGGHYAALTLSADRRTAFLVAETGTCRVRIDKVTLRGDGTVANRRSLPGLFNVQVDELAATADGGRLAFTFFGSGDCVGEGDGVTVIDSASGASREWQMPPPSTGTLDYVQSPAWAADGRGLFLATGAPAGPQGEYNGFLLRRLDTRAANTSILHAPVVLRSIAGLSSFRASPDGRTITAVEEVTDDHGRFASVAIVEVPQPLKSGLLKAPLRELARMTDRQIAPAAPVDFRVTLDATGRHLLVSSRRDRAIFRMDDGRFHRLPDLHRSDLGLIAW